MHLHGKLSGFVRNICKSKLLTNLLKLKSIIGVGNCVGDIGSHLLISGTRKIQTLFINVEPLFSKKMHHKFSADFFLGAGGKRSYILYSMRYMA